MTRKPLAACVAAAFALAGPAICHAASTHVVPNCYDDGSPYTLRSSIISSANGDTVDLRGLTAASPGCASGTININTMGQIGIAVPNLSILGPANFTITISSAVAAPGIRTRIFDVTAPGSGTLTISHLTIAHGSAFDSSNGQGGCIHDQAGVVELHGSTVTDCLESVSSGAFARGGAVEASGVTLDHSNVTNSALQCPTCTKAFGGGVFARETLIVENGSTVQGNSAMGSTTDLGSTNAYGLNGTYHLFGGRGGALYGRFITISNSTITGNTSQGPGGAIFVLGYYGTSPALTVTSSTISGNTATLGEAGGISSFANTYIYNSTLSGNTSAGSAGAIAFYGNGRIDFDTLKVANSTISGNTATSGETGGIVARNLSKAYIYNSTIASNAAHDTNGVLGTGVALSAVTTAKLDNTIIAGNTVGSGTNYDFSFAGGTLSASSDIVELPPPSGMPTGSNTPFTDPQLGPLQDNGGPTWTMLPAAAAGNISIAIAAGNDSVCAAAPVNGLDQRGVRRPQGAHCDIGAVEAVTDRIFADNFDGTQTP